MIVIISGLIAGFGGWALGSTVHTSDGKFEIGGAIAGLIAIWPALVTIFLRLRKARQAQEESGTKRELEKLQLKHEELKQKYIRSAPCPRGFRISLDENQKIILARPAEWTSRGGVIFDFDGASSKADIVPARFLVHYYPINRAGEIAGGQSNTRQAEEALREAHYQAICRHFAADRYVRVVAQSRIHLGGEPTPLESLYLIMRGYHAVSFVKDPVTGRTTRGWAAWVHLVQGFREQRWG
ncbi:MAG TPA: hypothetical protein VFG30_20485, partial [Polyangiales bacterium]|nr:hypothetical protein [Polyangiales bacterium]